jgi:hypothetical protein
MARTAGRVAAIRRRTASGIPRSELERLSLAAALICGVVFGVGQATGRLPFPIDFVIYWQNTNLDALYPNYVTDGPTPYLYVPVLAQLLVPFHVLPFELVEVGWTVVCFLSLWYCVRVWTIPVVIGGFLSIWIQPHDGILGTVEWVFLGNVQVPMAAAIVAGMRHPGWFAVPLVTKVTPGIGLLWYAFRGEWRRFALGVGITAVIAAVSFLLAPGTWADWLAFLIRNNGRPAVPPDVGPPLPLRLGAALLLVAWGARTNRPWVVAVAGALALPVIYGVRYFAAVAMGAWALRFPVRAAPSDHSRGVTSRIVAPGGRRSVSTADGNDRKERSPNPDRGSGTDRSWRQPDQLRQSEERERSTPDRHGQRVSPRPDPRDQRDREDRGVVGRVQQSSR